MGAAGALVDASCPTKPSSICTCRAQRQTSGYPGMAAWGRLCRASLIVRHFAGTPTLGTRGVPQLPRLHSLSSCTPSAPAPMLRCA